MKNRLLTSGLSLSWSLTLLGLVGMPAPAQACPYKNVSRYTYVYDSGCRCNRMVMVSGYEVDYLNCRTNSSPNSGSPTPSSQAQPQPSAPSTNLTLAQQYLVQRYQQCVQSGVAEPKCKCAFTRVAQAYTADQIVQSIQEKKPELPIAEGLALLLCPSK
jgi:hypothetical protein